MPSAPAASRSSFTDIDISISAVRSGGVALLALLSYTEMDADTDIFIWIQLLALL